MHLVQTQPDIAVTPDILAEFGDLLPLLQSEKPEGREWIIVSGRDCQQWDPERIAKGYKPHTFLPRSKLGSVLERAIGLFGLSNSFQRQALASTNESAETVMRYRLEDCVSLMISLSPQGPGYMMPMGQLKNTPSQAHMIYVNVERDIVTRMMLAGTEKAASDAILGSEHDWRFICLAHEIGHSRQKITDTPRYNLSPMEEYVSEMDADLYANGLYTKAVSIKPEMDSSVPILHNAARTVMAMCIPTRFMMKARNLPAIEPFTDLLSGNEAQKSAVLQDYVETYLMLKGGTRDLPLPLDQQYMISRHLGRTGLLNSRQSAMNQAFQESISNLLDSGVVEDGPTRLMMVRGVDAIIDSAPLIIRL